MPKVNTDRTKEKRQLQANIPDKIRFTVWMLIGLVVVIALLDLAGWIFGLTLLNSTGYYWVPLKVGSVCFLISSFALIIFFMGGPGKIRKPGMIIAGVVLIILGTLTIISWNRTGIWQDGLFIHAPIFNLFLSPEQRMPLLSALIFLFIGVIIILFAFDNRYFADIAHILLFPVSIAAYLIPVCYLLDIHSIRDFYNEPAGLNSGISFCAICIALYLARTDTWFMRVYASKSMGGIMARRLFPWIILIPIIIGRLRIFGEETYLFELDNGCSSGCSNLYILFYNSDLDHCKIPEPD